MLEDSPDLATLSDDAFRAKFGELLTLAQEERKLNQLLAYKPVSAVGMAVHESKARVLGIGGGNGSGKSELALLEVVMAATGVFPDSLKHLAKSKWRGPIAARVILESLTTTLYPVILPKLQHFKWSGVDQPGGERGHWGWIPKWCLVEGSWEKSWTDKLRTLRVLCRDPEDLERVVGESTITFMSKDQDPSDFASGDFHIIVHDEPPTLAIWRESEARTMRVAGRLLVAMTWPDDPAIPVDWIFDEIYEPGTAKQRGIEWFNIYTTDNRNLDQAAVAEQAGAWSTETRNVRLYGQPIRFSNRVHPVFTDMTQYWCFTCGKTCIAQANDASLHAEDKWRCEACGSVQVCEFKHVKEFEASDRWPCVFVLDPHPRKDHFFLWAMCDPSDDWWIIADGECAGDPVETRKMTLDIERNLGLNVVHRVADPNMFLSPSSSKRGVNWRDDFDAAGLLCSLGDDSHVGRERLNQFLKPDAGRWQPRIHIHPRCVKTIFQIKRFVWQDRKLGSERALLQVPKDKEDDAPACLKYLMNESLTFAQLAGIGQHYQRKGRHGAY
jgi:DNA-directed RNA polymerase subunit RPC12/RpoP